MHSSWTFSFRDGLCFWCAGAETWARADLGKFAADVGALVVDRAETGFRVEEVAVAAMLLREHKQFGTMAIAADDALFQETLGEFVDGALGFILVNHSETNEVRQFHFDRHGATAAPAALAQTFAIKFPS